MSTLLQISQDLVALNSLIDECDGELNEKTQVAFDQWFTEITGKLDTKLDNYAAVVKEREYRRDIYKEESEKLQRWADREDKAIDWLKLQLKRFFEHQRMTKFQGARHRLSVRVNGGLQPIKMTSRPQDLPDAFSKLVRQADNEKIRQALERGEQLGFAQLLPRGTHVRID